VIKALVIGLGNIGSQYDFNTDEVLTHVKSISLRKDMELSVFDVNLEKTNIVVSKYKCSSFASYDAIDLRLFDLVSICVPTKLHSDILKDCFKANVSVILCEKPIALCTAELAELKLLYEKSKSKVLVNYFRRFHPNYKVLQNLIKMEGNKDPKITVKYYKGWMNSASHALDTIQFLLKKEIDLNHIIESDRFVDFMPSDPSISLQINGNLDITCFAYKSASPLWELGFYFDSYGLNLLKGGQVIELYRDNELIWIKRHQLIDYMESVINEAFNLLKEVERKDNFMESLVLNKNMLTII